MRTVTAARDIPAKLKGMEKLVHTNTDKEKITFQLLIKKEARLLDNQSCFLCVFKKINSRTKASSKISK